MTPGEAFPTDVRPAEPDEQATSERAAASKQAIASLRREFNHALGLRRKDMTRCAVCGLGVMHDRNFTFFRVTLERYVMDLAAVQRAQGLELLMGAPALAAVMGPDEELAKSIGAVGPVNVCDRCATDKLVLAAVFELAQEPMGPASDQEVR